MPVALPIAGNEEEEFPFLAQPSVPLTPDSGWKPYELLTDGLPAATADTDILKTDTPAMRGGYHYSGAAGAIASTPAESPAAPGSIRQFFYDQIFFDSSRIDFGAVGALETRSLTVWNSFMTPVDLLDIIQMSGDDTGIEVSVASAPVGDVTGLDSVPLVLPSLAYMTIYVQVSQLGPPDIAASYRAMFYVSDLAESGVVGPDNHTIEVVGVRAQALIPRPNWEEGVEESLEFLTTIVPTYSGLEHRASMRDQARRRIVYRTLLTGDNASRLRSLLDAWQNRIFMCPLWQYEMRLPLIATLGASTFVMDTDLLTTAGVVVGQRVMFVAYAPNQAYEFLLVESLVADTPSVGYTTVHTTLPLRATWPAGSYVFPAGMAFIEGSVPFTRHTQDVISATISLLYSPADIDAFTPELSAPSTFTATGSPDGVYEVLEQEPNWIDGISSSHTFTARDVDSVTGIFAKDVTKEFPSKAFSFAWLLKDRTHIRDFRAFLGRRRGAWKSFMAPSWNTDFTVMADIALGQNFIICVANGFDTTVFSILDKNFFLELEYGAHKYRAKILSVDSSIAGQMRLSLDASFPLAIPAALVKAVRLMETYRLNADRVTLQWIHPMVATCSVEVMTVTDSRRTT